jgi:hypothetical protein
MRRSPVLYAILICSDPDCAQDFEGWGELDDFETMACECGCTLQALAFCEAEEVTIRPATSHLELRQAA